MNILMLIILGLVIVLWFIPVVFILRDPKVAGKEKAIWVFAVFFVSWFAWVLYYFIAPVMTYEQKHDNQAGKML